MGGIMAKKKKFHRLVDLMAKEMLRAQGGTATLTGGGHHAKLVVTVAGKTRGLAVAISPRKEETALWNVEKQLRNMIKEMRS